MIERYTINSDILIELIDVSPGQLINSTKYDFSIRLTPTRAEELYFILFQHLHYRRSKIFVSSGGFRKV